jgi:hypothetical protein
MAYERTTAQRRRTIYVRPLKKIARAHYFLLHSLMSWLNIRAALCAD